MGTTSKEPSEKFEQEPELSSKFQQEKQAIKEKYFLDTLTKIRFQK